MMSWIPAHIIDADDVQKVLSPNDVLATGSYNHIRMMYKSILSHYDVLDTSSYDHILMMYKSLNHVMMSWIPAHTIKY